MSAMEVSIKWKERSGAQSASGTSKKGTTSAVFFARMNFSPIPHDRIRPSLHGLKRILTEIRAARRTKCSTLFERKGGSRDGEFFSKNWGLQRRHTAAPASR